jgi:hypothetical protein
MRLLIEKDRCAVTRRSGNAQFQKIPCSDNVVRGLLLNMIFLFFVQQALCLFTTQSNFLYIPQLKSNFQKIMMPFLNFSDDWKLIVIHVKDTVKLHNNNKSKKGKFFLSPKFIIIIIISLTS